jgi:multidrug transporter EmrE-like cation transporter
MRIAAVTLLVCVGTHAHALTLTEPPNPNSQPLESLSQLAVIRGKPVADKRVHVEATAGESWSLTANGLPGVTLAWSGLLLGSASLAILGALRVLPFDVVFTDVPLMQGTAPWWVPLVIVAVIGTALGYAASIIATGMLGSRLMSFVALLEVVFATMFAWLTLGEQLTLVQLAGGALILAGIVLVQSEKERVEPVQSVEPLAVVEPAETGLDKLDHRDPVIEPLPVIELAEIGLDKLDHRTPV